MKPGISLALNTVGIAILVLVVVLVLGFIFLGYAARIVGIEDKCGVGVYAEYRCVAERPDGNRFIQCHVWENDRCNEPLPQDEIAAGTVPLCCRT